MCMPHMDSICIGWSEGSRLKIGQCPAEQSLRFTCASLLDNSSKCSFSVLITCPACMQWAPTSWHCAEHACRLLLRLLQMSAKVQISATGNVGTGKM